MRMKNFICKFIALTLCFVFLMFAIGCGDPTGAKLVKDAELSNSSYSLGDYMGDYTVTDINGNTHTFSDLLKEKKAIVLNFWFMDCSPCMIEFPFMQQAYTKYSDSIEILAINPVDKKESAVQKRAHELGLTFPVVLGDEAWISALKITGFPTTVVIDRYGCVAFTHTGYIAQDGAFEKIFERFSAEDYKQFTSKNADDIE